MPDRGFSIGIADSQSPVNALGQSWNSWFGNGRVPEKS